MPLYKQTDKKTSFSYISQDLEETAKSAFGYSEFKISSNTAFKVFGLVVFDMCSQYSTLVFAANWKKCLHIKRRLAYKCHSSMAHNIHYLRLLYWLINNIPHVRYGLLWIVTIDNSTSWYNHCSPRLQSNQIYMYIHKIYVFISQDILYLKPP